jgi:hypothetical protein
MEDYVSPPFVIHQGLPQGLPLSVILYILYNSSLLQGNLSLDSDQISLGYVDDVVHLAASKSSAECQRKIETLGSQSLQWGKNHGAIFDQKKRSSCGYIQRITQQHRSNSVVRNLVQHGR